MIAPVPFLTSAVTRASTESRGWAPELLSTSSNACKADVVVISGLDEEGYG